jgi:hypothetical protein
MRAPFSNPNSNEVNELYLLGAGAEGAAGAGACTLTSTFVPPPPNKRPLNANKTTTTMITKITKTATTPALPPPSPLSPMSSLLLWELRIQTNKGDAGMITTGMLAGQSSSQKKKGRQAL